MPPTPFPPTEADRRKYRKIHVAAGTKSASYEVGFCGLIFLLIFGPLAFGAVEPWAMLVQQVVAAVLVALWAVAHWRGESELHMSPLFWPAGALGFLVAGQLLFHLSAYRNATLLAALEAAVYAAVIFLASQTVTSRQRLKTFNLALTIFGTVLAATSILFSLAAPDKLYGLRAPRAAGMMFGPYVNHNHYAGLMEMLAAFPLLAAFRQKTGTPGRTANAMAVFLMAGSIFLSGSRGGMIAFAAELAFICLITIGRGSGRQIGRAVIAGLLLLAIFVAWYDAGQVTQALGSFRHPELSTETRRQIATDALHMAMARPTLGWGLGTFAWVYPQFRSFYTDVAIHAAHNDFVQALAELGFAGFAAVVTLLFIVFRCGVRRLRDWESDSAACVQLAALVGAGALLLHGLSDFNLQIPANAVFFFALCSVACARTHPDTSAAQRRSTTAPFLLLALVLVYGALCVVSFHEQRLAEGWDSAQLSRAAKLNRFDSRPWLRLGHLDLMDGNSEEAATELSQAVHLNPHDPSAWLELAQAQSTLADGAGARHSLAMAVASAPTTPAYLAVAAGLYFQIGEQQAGLAQLRKLTENTPDLMPAAVELAWRATQNPQTVLQDVAGANVEAEFALLQVLLDHDDLASAKQVWGRIASEHSAFDAKLAFPYLQFVIQKNDAVEAEAVWRAITAQPAYAAYRAGESRIVNGGFEAPALNAGFDWRSQPRQGVTLFLDPDVAHGGARSLALIFNGEISDTGVMQHVLVNPNTRYQLGGYFQSKALDGAGGLEWQIVENGTGTILGETAVLAQADAWQEFGADFTTGPKTRIVILRLARVPEGNVLTGEAWFDDLSLVAKQER